MIQEKKKTDSYANFFMLVHFCIFYKMFNSSLTSMQNTNGFKKLSGP